MSNKTLIKMLRRDGLPRPQAADQLDRVVHQILSRLKRGEPVELPGLGTFTPGAKPSFEFDANAMKKGKSHGRGRA